MTNREIGIHLGQKAREERRITNEVLELVVLGLSQRAYLEHGYSSMFDWLVRGFAYSHSAAYRRIEAARLIRAVPEAKEKLESGELNLTTLSRAQTAIRAHEKKTGKLSAEEKAEVVNVIENKSLQAAEQAILELLPDAASSVHQERKTVIDENTVRHSMNMSNEASQDLMRAKEILSHRFPDGSDAEVLAYALKFFLDRMDPLRKPQSRKGSAQSQQSGDSSREDSAQARQASAQPHHDTPSAAAATDCVTKTGAKRVMFQEANGGCSYKDEASGTVCGSRYQVQWDHVFPKALGGGNEPENLRPLCRKHNLMMAEQIFGTELMRKYWPLEFETEGAGDFYADTRSVG